MPSESGGCCGESHPAGADESGEPDGVCARADGRARAVVEQGRGGCCSSGGGLQETCTSIYSWPNQGLGEYPADDPGDLDGGQGGDPACDLAEDVAAHWQRLLQRGTQTGEPTGLQTEGACWDSLEAGAEQSPQSDTCEKQMELVGLRMQRSRA